MTFIRQLFCLLLFLITTKTKTSSFTDLPIVLVPGFTAMFVRKFVSNLEHLCDPKGTRFSKIHLKVDSFCTSENNLCWIFFFIKQVFFIFIL
jgi:hypothetical protein